MSRPKNVVNEGEVPWTEASHGEKHAWRRKRVGIAAGSEKLGCSLMELPPGKRSFPLHWHAANEEALYVIAGRGKLRQGDQTIDIGPGDYVALPVGAEHAHQLVNDGPEPLRYLAFSTNILPEVVHYPDSRKMFAVTGRSPTGAPLGGMFREGSAVDYWDGEE